MWNVGQSWNLRFPFADIIAGKNELLPNQLACLRGGVLHEGGGTR